MNTRSGNTRKTYPARPLLWSSGISTLGWPGFHKRYLKPTRDHATAVDCPTECGLGCSRKVVTHAPNDIVAVCPEQEEKPYPLKRQDILIYSVNRASLHKDICSALGIEHRENKVEAWFRRNEVRTRNPTFRRRAFGGIFRKEEERGRVKTGREGLRVIPRNDDWQRHALSRISDIFRMPLPFHENETQPPSQHARDGIWQCEKPDRHYEL